LLVFPEIALGLASGNIVLEGRVQDGLGFASADTKPNLTPNIHDFILGVRPAGISLSVERETAQITS
jgi:hypothetical protein